MGDVMGVRVGFIAEMRVRVERARKDMVGWRGSCSGVSTATQDASVCKERSPLMGERANDRRR